jgi:protein-disulfide isomerase-like protein with CxxC motif
MSQSEREARALDVDDALGRAQKAAALHRQLDGADPNVGKAICLVVKLCHRVQIREAELAVALRRASYEEGRNAELVAEHDRTFASFRIAADQARAQAELIGRMRAFMLAEARSAMARMRYHQGEDYKSLADADAATLDEIAEALGITTDQLAAELDATAGETP